jgi:hypothetical protein
MGLQRGGNPMSDPANVFGTLARSPVLGRLKPYGGGHGEVIAASSPFSRTP